MQNSNLKLQHPHIKAEIYYLTAKEGGRKTPIYSGYRGQFFYKSTNWDIAQEFIDKPICYPGEKVQVLIEFATAHNVLKINLGAAFQIREAEQVIGEGIITEVIDSDVSLSTTRKRLYTQIDEILWAERDPIGVNEHPEARDEYQSYVPKVFNLKMKDASIEEIADCLLHIERNNMGLWGKADHTISIARKIFELDKANK